MGLGRVRLAGASLEAYERRMVERVTLEDALQRIVEQIETHDAGTFVELAELTGVDLARSWVLNDCHYAEFGVVLLSEVEATGPPEAELPGSRRPAVVPAMANLIPWLVASTGLLWQHLGQGVEALSMVT